MRLIDDLAHRRPALQNPLLVGHEPYLSSLVSFLLTGGPGLDLVFKKGGLCKLGILKLRPGRCAVLEMLLTPRQMALMG
jgi:phosphohistidine phosphatase SixA